jgi:hypothetical protein
MKYLKRFESVMGEKATRIKEFCSLYLPYLVDNGFSIKFSYSNITTIKTMNIVIYKHSPPENHLISIFKWDDIKDDLIPFVEVLSKGYEVYEIMVEGRFGNAMRCELDEILNDDIDKIISKLPKYTDYGKDDSDILNKLIIRVLL